VYGATRSYANWLGEALSFPVLEAGPAARDAAKDADVVIVGSPVYMGRLKTAKWLAKAWPLISGKRVALFTVAGEEASKPQERAKVVAACVPAVISGAIKTFHLDGKLKFTELKFPFRQIIGFMAAVSKDPEMKKMRDVGYDRVDKRQIAPLVEWVASLK